MKPVEQLTDDEFAQHVHQAVRALPDAPAAWQQAALGLWQARTAQAAAPAPGVVDVARALGRLVAAVLTFDSWATPGLAHGMRSLRAPTRHLLYSAQGRDIDLRISPSAEHFALSGQILGPDETGRIELAAADATTSTLHAATHRATLDTMGEFRLEGVPAGRYVLTLHVGLQPDAEAIVVQPIEVGEPAA